MNLPKQRKKLDLELKKLKNSSKTNKKGTKNRVDDNWCNTWVSSI